MGEMADYYAEQEMYDELIGMLFEPGKGWHRRRTAREDFSQPVEENNMTNIRETAEEQLRRNEAERQRLLTRLALLDKFGAEDPWEDQTVLSFDRDFGGPRTYTHVAVRLGGVWYVTGNRNTGRSFGWEELVAEHLSKCIPDSLCVASEWMAYEDA